MLPAASDVASAGRVNKALRRAVAQHWALRRARTLPLSRMHDAVGNAATLRVFAAASRAAREQAAWVRDSSAVVAHLESLRFVLHVHAADGALLFAAAAVPHLKTTTDGSEYVALTSEDGAETLSNAAVLMGDDMMARCTASLFIERTLPGGGLRVACLVADAEAQVKRAPIELDEDDYYQANGWIHHLSDQALKTAPPGYAAVTFTSMRHAADANECTAEVALPPLLDFTVGNDFTVGMAQARFGWFAAVLRMPTEEAAAPGEITATLHCALVRTVADQGGFYDDVNEAFPSNDLFAVLRGLQWHCA